MSVLSLPLPTAVSGSPGSSAECVRAGAPVRLQPAVPRLGRRTAQLRQQQLLSPNNTDELANHLPVSESQVGQ